MNKEQQDTMEFIEPYLIDAVKKLLDDAHGISDEAYQALMELIYKINPESRSLEYMGETEGFKGRKFLNEDFELS